MTHTSEPNYIAATSGNNWWVNNDNRGPAGSLPDAVTGMAFLRLEEIGGVDRYYLRARRKSRLQRRDASASQR